MDERKKAILKAVTDDYIFTAEPVGSRTIARKYSLDISPATIRNEMADLEDAGYLEQPHTSSGRVPSDKGYRFYVDTFLKTSFTMENQLEKHIKSEYSKRTDEMNSIIKATAKMISDLSNYTAVVIRPAMKMAEIKQVNIVATDNNVVILLIFLTSGFVEHRTIAIEYSLSQEELNRISNVFNGKLKGKSIGGITTAMIQSIHEELNSDKALIDDAIKILSSICVQAEDRVYTDGIKNVLEHPEFRETSNIKTLFAFLESDDMVFDAMMSLNKSSLCVKIGSENLHEEIRRCSVVGAPYYINDQLTGMIGLIGPTRLDYRRTMGLVEFIACELSNVLNRIR